MRTHRVRASERRHGGWTSSYGNALTGVSKDGINSMLRGEGEGRGHSKVRARKAEGGSVKLDGVTEVT